MQLNFQEGFYYAGQQKRNYKGNDCQSPAKQIRRGMMALAKSEGIELTKDEAEAYMAELADVELDGREMKNVAGG